MIEKKMKKKLKLKFQNCKKQFNEEMKKIKDYVKNNNIKDKEITKKIKEFEGWERKAERGINDYIQKKEEINQFSETLKKLMKYNK